jgi:hypothetical protein
MDLAIFEACLAEPPRRLLKRELFMTQGIKNRTQGRVAITILYGIICACEIWAYISILASQRVVIRPSYWTIAIAAYCAYVCWSMVVETHRKSDRIAAFLMVILFVAKIVARFVNGHAGLVLRGAGCAAVVVGVVAMLAGLVPATLRKEKEISENL